MAKEYRHLYRIDNRVRAITKTTSLDRLRIVFSSTRRSYKPHAQPQVELNLHNTLLRVKRCGSESPGQVYDYRTLQEGAVPGQGLDRGPPSYPCARRAGPLARRHPTWTLREVPTESSTIGEVENPHTPRHPKTTDRRDRQIGKTRQLHSE